ncbi:SDR family NAD(P)-dependent oxidoreductase [soil metagenome]
MSKTILVCGHGPGISDAVARKFGAEGFKVALVARNGERLNAAVTALKSAGIEAAAFPTDLGDPAAVKAMVATAQKALGPVTVIHWNAYTGGAGDLTTADVAELQMTINVSVVGLVSAIQASLADLKAQKTSAVLVTGGGLAFYAPKVDEMAVDWRAMGLAVGKAAQHKAVGLLAAKLKADGIYVGEVIVLGMVKGTAFDHGNATLEPSAIADTFWKGYSAREPQSVNFGG